MRRNYARLQLSNIQVQDSAKILSQNIFNLRDAKLFHEYFVNGKILLCENTKYWLVTAVPQIAAFPHGTSLFMSHH